MAIAIALRVGRTQAPAGDGTAQRSVEVLISRLITDEEFGRALQHDARATLAIAAQWGLELTAS